NLLPRTLPAPPTYSKSNPADTPVLTLAVSSDNLPLSQVNDYADSMMARKIAQVSGVGLVTLNGGQKPAVRVQVDPVALAGGNLPRGGGGAAAGGGNSHHAQGRARRAVRGQRQPAQGQPGRAAPELHPGHQRPARPGGRLPAADRRVQ